MLQIGLYSPRRELLEEQRKTVEEFNESACLDLELRSYDTYDALMQGVSNLPIDVLFYDTEQSKDAEQELLRLVQTVPNCRLVLLSDSERHAVFGYALRAVGYLTTPLDKEEFLSQLIYLIREQIQRKEQFLPLKVNGVWSQIDMNFITFVESAGHNLLFHLLGGRTFKVLSAFKDYQRLLDLNPDFFRCHKSYMVNMRYVKDWSLSAFTLSDGDEVNISRPYRQAARCMYACYVTKPQTELKKNEPQPQMGLR